MARCGWCLAGDHAGHRPGGERWRCDCEACMSIDYYGGITIRWVCHLCGKTQVGAADPLTRVRIRHRCKEGDVTIIENAWAQIDAAVDTIRSCQRRAAEASWSPGAAGEAERDQNDDELQAAKTTAFAKAEILALLMDPYYPTPHDVSVEAMERWKARQAGTPTQTQGIDTVWKPGMYPSGATYKAEEAS